MKKKKCVMHVVECFGGGVLHAIAKLCYFVDDDCDIIIVYSRRLQTPDNFEKLFPDNVKFIEWSAVRQINPVKDMNSALDLRKIVKQNKPGILHLHSSKAGALGRIAFPFGGGMKILYTPHAYGFLQLDLSKLKQFIYWIIEKILGYSKHITVACGEGEYALAQKIARKSELINNSISVQDLDELAGNREKNKEFTVLSSGRICYQKNFPLFVEIARCFEDVTFIWVGGDVPDDIELPDTLQITGWCEYKDSIKQMARADIYIQTSLWEGLSLTVLEAMGLGLPIIVSDAVGNKEMIDEGKDGYVCKEVQDYVYAIKKLKDDDKLRQSFGKAAREKILRDYNSADCQKAWKKIYLE